jgi:hypothetical protein
MPARTKAKGSTTIADTAESQLSVTAAIRKPLPEDIGCNRKKLLKVHAKSTRPAAKSRHSMQSLRIKLTQLKRIPAADTKPAPPIRHAAHNHSYRGRIGRALRILAGVYVWIVASTVMPSGSECWGGSATRMKDTRERHMKRRPMERSLRA